MISVMRVLRFYSTSPHPTTKVINLLSFIPCLPTEWVLQAHSLAHYPLSGPIMIPASTHLFIPVHPLCVLPFQFLLPAVVHFILWFSCRFFCSIGKPLNFPLSFFGLYWKNGIASKSCSLSMVLHGHRKLQLNCHFQYSLLLYDSGTCQLEIGSKEIQFS